MVVLKKIKGSTLMETLVATVLIVVVFMISSMILNNLFSNSITSNTRNIDAYLNELEYLQQHDKLLLPYYGTYKFWEVSVIAHMKHGENVVVLEAVNPNTDKIISKTIK